MASEPREHQPGERRAAAQRRRRRRWRVRLTGLAAAALFGGALGVALMAAPNLREAAVKAYERVSAVILAQPEFVIRRVQVEGATHVPDADIVAALGLTGGPISSLDFNVKTARHGVEALGWVSEARVRALPPQLVEVVIVERRPAARWRRDGRLALIDAEGALIVDDLAPYAGRRGGANLRDILSAPLLVGAGADAAAAEALRLDAAARAAGFEAVAWTRVGERRWDLEILDGPRVMLPSEGAEAAFAQFVFWARETDLLEHGFVAIDLRDPHTPVGRRAL